VQAELALSAISHTVIGLLLLTLLIVLLISLRRELTDGEPFHGIVHFGLSMIAICTLVALLTAFVHARKAMALEAIGQRIDAA
jgi:hypothetical protein